MLLAADKRNLLDVLDGDVLDVEADVVAGKSLGHGLVVHLHGLDLSGQVDGGEVDHAARLQDTTESTLNYFGGFFKIVPKIWI